MTTFVSNKESDPWAGIRLRVELLLLDQSTHTIIQLIDLFLEDARHQLEHLISVHRQVIVDKVMHVLYNFDSLWM